MAGTRAGGKAAAQTNRDKYGSDFYRTIGRAGGKIGKTGGFASVKVGADGLTGRERAITAGTLGGLKSRRGDKEWHAQS